jgi:hypothetical protein
LPVPLTLTCALWLTFERDMAASARDSS